MSQGGGRRREGTFVGIFRPWTGAGCLLINEVRRTQCNLAVPHGLRNLLSNTATPRLVETKRILDQHVRLFSRHDQPHHLHHLQREFQKVIQEVSLLQQ